jgi:hypothetical protein
MHGATTLIHRCFFALSLGLWLTPLSAGAEDCIDYGDYLGWIGALPFDGSIEEVAIAGTTAYAAVTTYDFHQNGHAGLAVFDISVPESPELLGSVEAPSRGAGKGVAVRGTDAYLADSWGGLRIVDVSDPASPEFVGSHVGPGVASGVVVDDLHAYVVNGTGLEVINIQNPTSPRLTGQIELPGWTRGIALRGQLAYVVAERFGLYIVDVGTAGSPLLLHSFATPGWVFDVAVNGTHAYVASDSTLYAIDVTGLFMTVGNLDIHCASVALDGNLAYVSGRGFKVIDISDPTAPYLVGNLGIGLRVSHGGGKMAVNGDLVCLPAGDELYVVDVSTPTPPAIAGSADMPGNALDVASANAYAFVAAGGSGLQLVDTSNPSAPLVTGELGLAGVADHVTAAGSFAYVTDDTGLKVIDIADPFAPAIAGSTGTRGYTEDLATAGGLAFIVNRFAGLQIIDISNPGSPTTVSELDTPDVAFGVDAGDRFAYVAALRSGLQIIDLSNPGSPSVVGGVATRYALDVDVEGATAYLADGYWGFKVIDISTPLAPVLIGSAVTPGFAGRVNVADGYAYVGDETSVHVFDVSNPASPMVIGSVDTPGAPFGLAVDRSWLLVADGQADLQVLPLQCRIPNAVTLAAFEATPRPGSILITWRTSFESNHLGFHLLRSPRRDGGYAVITPSLLEPPGPYSFLDQDVLPATVYFYRLEALDRRGGSQLFGPISAAAATGTRFALSHNHPNPFRAPNSPTEIRFELPRRHHATLRIFDPSGRLVRVVFEAMLEAGAHNASWDGRDDRGDAVAPGIYFYRLDAGDFSQSRKLILLD